MNTTTALVRPDTLTSGDYVFNRLTKEWEPVQAAYWSDVQQLYIVHSGPKGDTVQQFEAGSKITKRNYY